MPNINFKSQILNFKLQVADSIFKFLFILSEKTTGFIPWMKRILSEDQRTTAFRPWISIVYCRLIRLASPLAGLLFIVTLSGCSAIGFNNPAALQVTSVPEASVFLDGKHLGKTPFFSDQLKNGEHELKIAADGAAYVSKIFLEGSTLTVVNRQLAANFLAQSGETLTLIKGKNGLFIVSDPANSIVTIDGKLSGTTPVLIKKIEDGEHKITLSKEGFITREFTIKSTSSYQLLVNANLASEIAKQLTLPSPEEPKIQKIEILPTPQGFLRVRQEPNTISQEIGRVKTGDQLEFLQEIKDWSKVVFSSQPAGQANKQGWVSTQYIKKLP